MSFLSGGLPPHLISAHQGSARHAQAFPSLQSCFHQALTSVGVSVLVPLRRFSSTGADELLMKLDVTPSICGPMEGFRHGLSFSLGPAPHCLTGKGLAGLYYCIGHTHLPRLFFPPCAFCLRKQTQGTLFPKGQESHGRVRFFCPRLSPDLGLLQSIS